MKKVSYLPVFIIIASFISIGLSSNVDYFALKAKFGILGKVGLLIGIIGLWLYTLIPIWSNSKEVSKHK